MGFLNSGFRPAYLFFLCLSFCSATNNALNCDPNDYAALKEFAARLVNGPVILPWPNGTDCCSWAGVSCERIASNSSSSSNRVSMLRLSESGLEGNFSDSLFKLDGLKWLDLSYNFLKGPLKLSGLKHLQVLDLSHNELTGPAFGLPVAALLPQLITLNISHNLLTGRIDPGICSFSKSIQTLDLSFNEFTGGLEAFENCITSLRELHLDSNSLSGEIPRWIYSWSSLEQLTIPYNNFSGQLSLEIGKLSKLKTLVLSGNRFSGYFPNVFSNLTGLEQLIGNSNSFTGRLPSTLSACSNLRLLDLRNNSLSGPIDLDFSALHSLKILDLAHNRFSGALPESLSGCHSLRTMTISRNRLTGPIPSSYANLSSLVFLSLSNNSLVNLSSSLSVLGNCPNLTALILTENFHREEIPENLTGLKHLSVLALGNCGLRGRIPKWLLNSLKLQVLDLSWNRLEGSIPPWIGRLENLFYLDFSNNSLSGGLPKGITEIKCLISVSSCDFTSLDSSTSIPLIVKRNQSMKGLQYSQASSFPPSLLLSNNRINGTICPEIGQLRQLHALDLSRNNITGSIPWSISKMKNLEVLDLSSNDLSGPIPSSFDQLTFLSRFSVASNRLEGAVPTGGQFPSFPNSSFEGNPGICGVVSPCGGRSPPAPTRSGSGQFFRGARLLGLTIGVGIGVGLVVAVTICWISRRDADVGPGEEAIERDPRLVIFENADCGSDLTVEELLRSTGNFGESNIVGCGGFGLVYRADLPGGGKAAVKRLSGDCGQMEREFRAEVEALSKARHENLVSLQGYCLHGVDRLLIYSYMENGSLDYWLHEKVDDDDDESLKWETRLRIARGAARGLAYLHKETNIVHRDVKTSNILLDGKFEARLADFGLSRLLHPYDTHVTTDLVGTLGYIPPEYSQTMIATFRGDVYSFGVVILELVTGRRPVEVCRGRNCRDLVGWVYQKKDEGRVWELFDSSVGGDGDFEKQLMELLDVACWCVDKEPRRRPSIDEVVSLLEGIEIGKSREV